jgi:hypothetical protein
MKTRKNFTSAALAFMPSIAFATTLIIAFIAMMAPTAVFAVTLPFQTTFNCPESHGYSPVYGPGWQNGFNCDGMIRDLDYTCMPGELPSWISSDANMAAGDGGRGLKVYVGGPDRNNNSGGIAIPIDSPVQEFWIRLYMMYPLGMRSTIGGEQWGHKILWITGPDNRANILQPDPSGIQIWNQGQVSEQVLDTGWTWNQIWGHATPGANLTADGQWHLWEMYIKYNSGANDGVQSVWIDNVLRLHQTGLNINTLGANLIRIHVNQAGVDGGVCVPIYFDDIAVSTTGRIGPLNGGTPAPTFTLSANPTSIASGASSTLTWSAATNATSCTASGETFTGSKSTSGGTQSVSPTSTTTYTLSCTGAGGTTNQSATVTVTGGSSTLFLSERFDDHAFSSRGWFDGNATSASIDSTEHIPGSTSSFKCLINQGGIGCSAGTPTRFNFSSPTDRLYVSYWVKYSANYVSSGPGNTPHQIYFLTDLDSDYAGFFGTYLTTYIEEDFNQRAYRVAVQDSRNVNTSYGTPPQDLVSVTENRAIAGCNGPIPYFTDADIPLVCFYDGSSVPWKNFAWYKSRVDIISDSAGPYYKVDWHRIEVYLQMNSISGGVAQSDGIIRMKHDGVVVLEKTNMIFRTGARPNQRWKQIAISPYYATNSGNSPVTQTMWIDDLVVMDAPINSLASPTNFRIIQ